MFHLFRFVYNFTVGHEHRAPTAMYIALLLLYYYFGGNNFCNDSTIVTKYSAFVPTTKKSVVSIGFLFWGNHHHYYCISIAFGTEPVTPRLIVYCFPPLAHIDTCTLSTGPCTPKPVRNKERHTIKSSKWMFDFIRNEKKTQRIFAFLFSMVRWWAYTVPCMTWISVGISRIEVPEVFIPVCRLSMLW